VSRRRRRGSCRSGLRGGRGSGRCRRRGRVGVGRRRGRRLSRRRSRRRRRIGLGRGRLRYGRLGRRRRDDRPRRQQGQRVDVALGLRRDTNAHVDVRNVDVRRAAGAYRADDGALGN
jgi:hypothetical protein